MDEKELLKEYPTAYHPNDPAAEQLERLVTHFEDVAQSWSKVVYPALFAFILLAIYGFYLIFSLTTDVRKVADSMKVITSSFGDDDSHMSHMSFGMDNISHDVGNMAKSVDNLTVQVSNLTKDVKTITAHAGTITNYMDQVNANMSTMTGELANLSPMLERLNSMDYSTQVMASSTHYMGRELGDINDDMSPGGFVSRFMPF